jgi:hypothetical protein
MSHHREHEEADMAAGEVFGLFCKSAATAKPAVGALNDPALGQHAKALGYI